MHVSTDEVYGSIPEGSWDELRPLEPNSPYSASKAGSDLLARAYARTFGMEVCITRCSNNYGPHQFPEKVIPLFVTNLMDGLQVPLYGEGVNVRDWLHVDDHCRGINLVLAKGRAGETYNIGGGTELTNVATERLLAAMVSAGRWSAGSRTARATTSATPWTSRRSLTSSAIPLRCHSSRVWPTRSSGTRRTSHGGVRSRKRSPPVSDVPSSRWLVVGANGMLGHDLMEVISESGHDVVGMDLPEIDITSASSVAAALDGAQPQVVVNAAAYTAVDAAEEHEDVALRVNGEGPRVLAEAVAARPDLRLVHISTDYVFAGDASTPYAEDAPTAPRSAYGRTKLAGEIAVRNALPDRGFIVRTAWLYGVHGANFVKTMLALEASKQEISVVDDQHGQPTWSRDLARQIVALLGSGAPSGIYHGTSSGETTWFDLTQEIYRLIGADPDRVQPTTTDAFPRPAPRPAYSVLGHGRWGEIGLDPIRHWSEALTEALPQMRA